MSLTRAVLKGADSLSRLIPLLREAHPDFPTLDPFLYQILQLRQKSKTPLLHQMNHEDARKMYRKETARIKANFSVQRVEELNIPIQDISLSARLYQPVQNHINNLLIYFHGGGGVIGDLDTHDDICRLICRKAGIQVISVEYRLAPEFPAPTAHQDAFHASQWIHQHREDFGVLADGIYIGGDSAGGNLAISAGLKMARVGTPVLGQLLFYPSTDFSREYPSERQYGKGLFLDQVDREWFQCLVFQDASLKQDPNISPMLAADISLSPKTVMRTAELDVLRDQAEQYVDRLRQQGIKVNFKRDIGLGHAYANFASINKTSYGAVIDAVTAFKNFAKES